MWNLNKKAPKISQYLGATIEAPQMVEILLCKFKRNIWNLLKKTPKISQYLGATIKASQMGRNCTSSRFVLDNVKLNLG